MATPTADDTMAQCAACGNGGDGLKKCTACKLVKYCGVACQQAHRPQHKKACKKRAAELHDEALFKQPPSREECPICFLELPLSDDQIIYQTCCGKSICKGCVFASSEQSVECPLCPFCRKPAPHNREEARKRLDRRAELQDPEAMAMLGLKYVQGCVEYEQDIGKALELFHRAVELGSIVAHSLLGNIYYYGKNGVQANYKKAEYHLEVAAMGGYVVARYNLGVIEGRGDNHYRTMKHLMISASAGCDDSLKGVHAGYRDGKVIKDDFEQTLRAHKKSSDELKSEWREKAKALGDQDLVI